MKAIVAIILLNPTTDIPIKWVTNVGEIVISKKTSLTFTVRLD
jgi:hypothetical protein